MTQATQPRALILAGDHHHVAEHAFQGVGEVLEAEGVSVECTADYAAPDAELLADVDLLVILRDGIEWRDGRRDQPYAWMEPHQEEAIEALVLGGGGFLALHNAGWAYPWQGAYRRTLGGYWIGHPPMAEFTVHVVNQAHPITDGVESYRIVDEQHWLHWDYERVTPLLISQGQDGRGSVSGWAYEYGQGRVAYLPHGHTLEVLRHPSNVKLMRNAARWLLRRS
jgi:type 1 glutamine amidotransferase